METKTCSGEDELWDFAKESLQNVMKAVAPLTARTIPRNNSDTTILVEFTAQLCLATVALNKPTQLQRTQIRRRLRHFLFVFENLCVVSSEFYEHCCIDYIPDLKYFPSLHALNHSRKFATRIREDLQIRFEKLLDETPHVFKTRIRKIEDFLGNRVVDEPETPELRESTETHDDYPKDAHDMLYSTLRKHAICTCPLTPLKQADLKGHDGRLRLEGDFRTQDGSRGSELLYDLVYSTLPLPKSADLVEWQQILIGVQSNNKKVMKTYDSEESKEDTPQEHELALIELEDLCEVLRTPLGPIRVRINVSDGNLHHLPDPEEADPVIAAVPSMSLAEVRKSYRLTAKLKVILAYKIARSVWQFYTTDWMKTKWSSETIHFMFKGSQAESSTEGIYAKIPFFAFQFEDTDQQVIEYCTERNILHRYPHILALGVLLVDIGKEVFNVGRPSEFRTTQEEINSLFCQGKKSLGDPAWPVFEQSGKGNGMQVLRRTYKAVVEHCFSEEMRKAANTNIEDQIERRRTRLYEKVVQPLRQLLEDTQWSQVMDDDEIIEKTEQLVQPSLTADQPRKPGAKPVETLSKGRIYDVREKETGTTSSEKKWLDSWKHIVPLYFTRLNSDKRIKVAILDTGVDLQHSYLQRDSVRYPIICESFVQDAPADKDPIGHGTHIVGILRQLAPNASLYCGRIAVPSPRTPSEKDESDGIDINDQALIQGLKWASQNEVDIISLSFGIHRRYVSPELERQLNHAVHQGILVFAAASNQGRHYPIPFPAERSDVFCIFSSNGFGKDSKFSPKPRENNYNFAALGEQVTSYKTGSRTTNKTNGYCTKSGTSMAAPIAAAFVALILEYVHLEAQTETGILGEWHLRQLHTYDGMCKVLASPRMSELSDIANLRSLTPWKMWSEQGLDERDHLQILYEIKSALES